MLKKLCFASVLITAATGLFSGCAWVPQKVELTPQAQVQASSIGNGAAVVVNVRDIRPAQRIGYRGLDSKGAEITTDQDVAALFQQKIMDGLGQQGFRPLTFSEDPARLLKVEICALQYTTDMDFWKGTVHAKAEVQVHAKTAEQNYEQRYIAEREEKALEAPGAKTNARIINGVLSDVLQRLLGDAKLVRALAN